MWIPISIETREPDILGKQMRKRVGFREKKPNFAKLGASLQSPKCFQGTRTSEEKNIYSANSTRPVGQVLLEIHSSEIRMREYLSWTGGRADERKFFVLSVGKL